MSKDKIINKARSFYAWVRRYRYLIAVILILTLFGYTVWRIDYLSSTERDEQTYQEQLSTVEKIKFNQEVIDRILKLHSTGVNVKPNLPDDRTNPFE